MLDRVKAYMRAAAKKAFKADITAAHQAGKAERVALKIYCYATLRLSRKTTMQGMVVQEVFFCRWLRTESFFWQSRFFWFFMVTNPKEIRSLMLS